MSNDGQSLTSLTTDYNASRELKSYWVQVDFEDWGMFFHAASAGKAKYIFMQSFPGLDKPDWTDVRAVRCKGADLLDVTPFTDDTLRLAGYPIPASDDLLGEHDPDSFLMDCPCSMCRYERAKPSLMAEFVVQAEA